MSFMAAGMGADALKQRCTCAARAILGPAASARLPPTARAAPRRRRAPRRALRAQKRNDCVIKQNRGGGGSVGGSLDAASRCRRLQPSW